MFSHRLVPCQERSQMGFTGGVQGSDWLWGSSPPASPFARGEGCRGAGAAATKCGPNRSRLSTRGLLGISRGACPRPLPFLCLPPELCGCGTPHKACQPPRGQAGRELPARARHPAAATGLPDPRGAAKARGVQGQTLLGGFGLSQSCQWRKPSSWRSRQRADGTAGWGDPAGERQQLPMAGDSSGQSAGSSAAGQSTAASCCHLPSAAWSSCPAK